MNTPGNEPSSWSHNPPHQNGQPKHADWSAAWLWSHEYSIPSETCAGKCVLDELIEQLSTRQWGEHDIFGIRLATEEALVNAIKHGNRFDPAKRIRIVCRMSHDQFVIEIADEGEGFDPDQVPDCTAPENLESPSGRGIMLMRSFMSRVEYLDMGTRVVMEKRRT
jgi:serine/threonine-protein kinase RsbW